MKHVLWTVRLLLVFVSLVAAIGCDLKISDKAKEKRSHNWAPEQVAIQCADPARCPSHQGILFGYYRLTYSTMIERCTASLYDGHHVITAGHCRFPDAEKIYFLPVPKPGLPSHMILATFVAGQNSGDSDYASFELAENVLGREFVYPVAALPVDFSKMVALVVNPTGVEDHYKLDAMDCVHVKSPHSNPMIDQNPIQFTLPGCHTIKGNSGGVAVQADNFNSVYGVLSSGPPDDLTPTEQADRIRIFGSAYWANFTNVRCVPLPGWPMIANACPLQSH